ncbi:E3 ubiquitin-protein ligase RNF19A-like isoform X2 [Teleopsis dalmanni]|uniref:E3 ubiquitin-protein ligase RNF19A-like isoform X2 n=1 Tax=Teleopsis dalmanni TaxID=139649 RepID=UPI0018CDCC6A|nr:E3 ubiquitin-protein ligase RNF19A-like isoform X2 [Teleopsis dalmanni]
MKVILLNKKTNDGSLNSNNISEQCTEKYNQESGAFNVDDTNFYCTICCLKESLTNTFFTLELCGHKFCTSCLVRYLKNEINESRTDIACPQCSSVFHPNNIELLLTDVPEIKNRYEDFMIRRYLVSDPDSRWCPAPDCSYAVIASGCASCPQLQCKRPSCGLFFCYHCKSEWHPNQTCDAARSLRQKAIRSSSVSFSHDSIRLREEMKPCPRCQVLIVKMNDGSCNHMVCSVCGAEFCWLCMKEVSDLHYLSPSGCTFWGKKPWSKKKKIVWQIGTLIGAPVGIALLAGIAIPSLVIGVPIWVGRKLFDRFKTKTKKKRNVFVTIGVTASILISPFLAGLAIAIGVPILLFYVYGVVPVSLCRAGCRTSSGEEYIFEGNTVNENHVNNDTVSIGTISRVGRLSAEELNITTTNEILLDNTNNTNASTKSLNKSTTALEDSIQNAITEHNDSDSIGCMSRSAIRSNSENSSEGIDTISNAVADNIILIK